MNVLAVKRGGNKHENEARDENHQLAIVHLQQQGTQK